VRASAILVLHADLQTKVKRSGKGGWIMETKQGDEYTRDLGGLGYAQVDDGREKGFYREPQRDSGGTRTGSTARPRGHDD